MKLQSFLSNLVCDEIRDSGSFKVQMKCFVLLLNLKEQEKSGRSPFTVSLNLF